jgi:hypothetical protein
MAEAGLDPERGGLASVRSGHAGGTDLAQRGYACCGSPGRDGSARTISRIGFLGSGLVAAAGTLGGYAVQATAAETKQVWALDPLGGGDAATCGCSACSACVAHGAGKLFASAVGADAGRAHPYCNCAVVPFARVDPGIYDALFSDGAGRDSVDRRHQWVQAVLAHDPPSAGLSTAVLGRDTARNSGDVAAQALRTVHAVLGRVRVRRGPTGRRWLTADIDAYETVTASLTLSRQGPTAARKVVGDVSGTRRIRLAIPPATKPGAARLRVRLRNADGSVKVVTRSIRIPHA